MVPSDFYARISSSTNSVGRNQVPPPGLPCATRYWGAWLHSPSNCKAPLSFSPAPLLPPFLSQPLQHSVSHSLYETASVEPPKMLFLILTDPY